jgi:hypothetical protein
VIATNFSGAGKIVETNQNRGFCHFLRSNRGIALRGFLVRFQALDGNMFGVVAKSHERGVNGAGNGFPGSLADILF